MNSIEPNATKTQQTLILALAIAIFFLSIGFFCRPNPPVANEKQAHLPDRSFFLVMIDGPRYSETIGSPSSIPRLWNELKPQGTLLRGFRNTGPTLTCPGHLAALTGGWQSVSNDGSSRSVAPTVFEYYRKKYGTIENSCVVFSQKEKLKVTTHSYSPEYGEGYQATFKTGASDLLVFRDLIDTLKKERPRLVLLNLASPDIAGHGNKWYGYLKAIEECDQMLYELWNFLQSDPFYQNKTNLIMTNDHGRHLNGVRDGFVSHGCACEGCQLLSFFAIGPDIKKDQFLPTQHTLIDICPTIGFLMQFETPYAQGQIIEQILEKPPSLSTTPAKEEIK